MSGKKIKIIGTILLVITLWFGLYIVSNAGTFSASISDTTVEVGDTFTVTIKVSNGAGMYLVSTSNSNVSVASGSTYEFIENGSTTVTFKANKTGTVNITASADDITDSDTEGEITGSKTFSVTIKSASSGNSSSSSGSDNRGSNSSSGNSSSSNGDDDDETTAPTFRNVNETVYVTDSGINVRSSYSTSSSSIGTLNAGDELTRTGVATSAVGGITWSRVTYEGRTAYVSSSYLTTEKPEESNNKALSSLTINGYTLTPEFSSDITEYTLNVPDDVTSLEIDAVPEDDNAEVEITGNDGLLDGVNTVEIRVIAEDGTARTYTISVTKGEFSTIGLSELSVDGYTLNPAFSTDIYEYILEIHDLTVTSLDINAVADQENASVEIVGNTELKPGENIITILVKSEDGSEIGTYQIIVNITESIEEQLIPGIYNDDLFLYGGIALGVIVLIIIIAVIRHRRKMLLDEEDDDYEPYYGGFDSLNRDVNKNNNLSDTQDLSNVINNKNIPNVDETQKVDLSSLNDKKEEKSDPIKEHRKSVIEENFGADIKNDEDNKENKGRRRGKHF